MVAPAAAVRWPDPMSTANPAANAPAPAAEQSAEVRPAPAATAAAPPQIMPRAVPPVPASEKPLSPAMLITIVAGGLSVVVMIISMLVGWRASRPRLTPSAPMPPLEEQHDRRAGPATCTGRGCRTRRIRAETSAAPRDYFSSWRCRLRTNSVRPTRRARFNRSALRIACTSRNASSTFWLTTM